ncbi:MAG: hydroxymethylglutaryl-CoA synthase [Myxococcota bacterium]
MSHALPDVGIDDLHLYAGSLAVDAATIVAGRGNPADEVARLKLQRRSLAPQFEDPVTLAVNAAKPVVASNDPRPIELLIVATESPVDDGKPLSSYVHHYLDLGHRCRNVEVKHACYAGTASLRLASSWVATNPEKRALVVMADMARKLFGDPAEPAEGAGSIALSVAADPRVLRLEPKAGYAAREVYDVTRPTPTLERINSGLSLGAYLDLLEIALGDYRKENAVDRIQDHCAAICYHTPLVPLVEQAHQIVVESDDEFPEDDVVAASWQRLVAPSLAYCQQMGNLYGGCLYAALAGRIDAEPALAAGDRIGLYSYGSGSCAEFFSGIVGAEARAVVGRHGLANQLADRTPIDFAQYEGEVLAMEQSLTEPDFDPNAEAIPGLFAARYTGSGRLVLDSVRDYYRQYRFA